MSSTEETEEASDTCCANCGVAEVDEIKLEDCDGCKSVRCCGDKHKEEHRERHEEECKERADELRDDDLFRQPDGTHFGECPICCLPMPIEGGNACFIHAAANLFVWAVFIPIEEAAEAVSVHSVESHRQLMMKIGRRE